MTTSTSFAQMANNQSISLSSALRANTPPTKGQTTSRKFLTLSIFFLLSFFCTTHAWGAEYSYTFTSKQFTANGSKTLNSVSWTLAGDGNYWGYDGTKGQQFGSGSAPYKTLTLSTSGISGTIKKIIINTSGASSVNASFTVSVGGTQWGNSTKLTTTATAYTFTGSKSGEIKFLYTQTSSKALYIKSISVTYETAASYTVTYNVNGGSGTMSNSTGSSISLKGCTFTAPSGKEFKEWNTNASGNGTSYQPGDIVTESLDLYAIWQELPKYTVTLNAGPGTCAASVTETSAGAGVTLLEPTLNCGDWKFAGWAEESVSTETTTKPTLFAANSNYKPKDNITLCAVYQRTEETPGAPTVTTTTDKLTRETTGVTKNSTSYSAWSGKTSNSDAVYAGNSAGGNDAIQLRSNNSNSGIVTTTSGGKAKKVIVVWQSSTADDRTLDIYGKNSAYTAATDLYSTSTQGTKLGSIAKGSTTLTITGDYEYIGLCSNSGAMYLTSISIEWETTSGGGSTTTTYYHSTPDCGSQTDCSSLTFANNIAANHTATYTQNAPATELTVVASLMGATYQWYSNTTNSTTSGTAIDGATNSRFQPLTSVIGTTYYYCVATYNECTIKSNVATIVVNAQIYTITIDNNIQYGIVEADKFSAEEGETVKLTITPTSGYKLETITVTKNGGGIVEVQNNQFTMPASNVTVSATFDAIPQLDTPTNLQVTNITCTGATLSWGNVTNNNGYTLSITNTSSSQTFNSTIAKNETSGTPPLNPGITYTWKVVAKGDGTNYNDSEVADGGSFTTNYKITYDVKGGSWTACADGCVAGGEDFTICSTVPTKTGYNFMGWSTADDQIAEYQAEETIENVSANITLYAVWEQKKYTVNWYVNGTSKREQTDVEGAALTDIPEPTTSDCDNSKVFVGWTTKADYSHATDAPDGMITNTTGMTMPEGGEEYYAVFATKSSGGAPEETTLTIPYGTLTAGLSNSYSTKNFTYGGFTFEINACVQSNYCQMRDNATLSYIYIPELPGAITKIATSDCKNASGSSYTGTLRLKTTKTRGNSETDDIEAITYSSVNSFSWSLSNETYKTGYLFTSAGLRIKDLSITYTTSGGTSYSEYVTTCVQVTKYNVTYTKGDGATGTTPTESPKAEGTEFTLASADGLTKDGYSFAGWLCDNDSKIYGASDKYTMPAADVTFTAQWNELPKYTVTFYNKGKKHSEVTQTTAFAAVECPTGLVACDGYTSAGWSTEELDGVSSFTKIEGEYTPKSNITLYAVYAEGNATTNGWVKVTDLSTITEGTYALLSNNDYAFNGTINNNSDGEHTTNSFVFNGEGVASEAPSGTCEIELIASGDGFKMYSEGKGYLYAKAAKSGNLAWQQNENSFWSWDSTKDNWVYADKEAFLRSYNNTFRTYGTNNGNAIYFAKKNVTSFTTSPACDPMITIGSAEPVMVTSANGIRVDAVQNITIAATNLDQNADEAQVSIKIVSNNSAFKFKEVGANGDGQVTSTWTGIANATFDKTLCVTYTPTVSGREETATLTVTAYRHNGSTEYATATMQVRGRSLPEQFVLVANTTDGWVALPNTLGTGSSSSIPYPIAVEVDNDADPTSIPQAPSTTIYKAAARSSVNYVPTGLRFTTEAGGYLQASTSETNIWLSSNNSENMQSWTLNSTDFVDYSIRVNNAAEGHYLNYSNTQKKIGNYKSDNKLRILPVGAVCEQHAAPEDIEASSVRATSATIQWSAVSTATAGYEYRIGATGEWTKIGNVTELEITGLDPLTNYVVYVRASVEGAIINCSNEAKVSFTTVNCDDVPTNITHTSSSQSITVSWEAKAATSIVKLYSDKEGTTEVKSIESSSPCTLSDLEKYTTYYVQILAGGTCPSQIIEVSTLIPNINIAEWMVDGILVDVDTDEDVSVVIENEESYGSGSGQVAEELFFSKYFEGSGSLKLLAIYNGTGKDVDLSTYRIDRGSNGNATNISKTYDLSQLGTINNGQEIIFYSWPLNTSSEESVYSCSQSFLNAKSKESGADANPRWILCDANPHNGVEFEAMDFSGDDPLLFYKDNTLIDVFGVSTAADRPSKKTQCSGRSEESWSADGVTNMDYNKTDADFEGGVIPEGVDLLNPTITAYTARVIMFRKNTITSGSDAVRKNTTDFVTFADEWEARSVCKSGGDGDLTCAAYQELGTFNYSEYYTKYNTVGSEQVFPGENRTDGTVKITIEGLPNYSCHNIKLNLKIGEDLKLTEITKVPILISDEQTTKITSSTFTTLKSTLGVIDPETKEKTDLTDEQLIEKCETCDIVVLANGKLTHETDGIDQFRDLTIYPEGTFHNNDNISVDRLLVHAKRDEVGCAIIENEGVTLTTNAIAHTKRIDAQYWYPFSLPYNCNIADITQANGESLGTYGVHWGIQYYDGKKRQESGTSAGIGQSSNFWTPIYNSNEQLKAYQGYMIALFDASVSSPTEMRTIYFPPVSAQMYTESGIDSKETTITSWNVNLEAEKRHHGWNFTGSPYISVFNPQATGLSEDRGLFSEVLIVSGHYDQGSNEYLYDDEFVYVSIPSPNGAKYYDQYITSATSLKPFTAYFVQAIDPTSGNDETQTLAYAKAGRELPSSAPRRSTSTRQRVLVELGVTAPDGQTDNTGIWVDEKYTSAYEIAADLTKMYVAGDRPQLYTMAADNEKMAYNALPDEMAGNVQLGLYAPTAGSYTLFINERVSRLKGVERVDLLYNNVVVADLLSSAYVIDVPKKGAVNGYTISVCRKANVTTAIDNISGQPINIITGDGYLTLEGIVSDAQVSVYDMLGRLVAAQNANDETKIRIPFIVQGVYNVVVKNEQGMTTIKVVLR